MEKEFLIDTLVDAVLDDNRLMATMLLTVSKVDPNDYCSRGYIPLHMAVKNNNLPLVKLLLGQGANPNIRCPYDDSTALIIAARHGHTHVFQVLLDYGADIHAIDNTDKWNVLMHAVETGHIDVVNTLLERGCSINWQDENGETPLMIAAQFGQYDMCKYILSTNSVNLHAVNNKNKTAKDHAINFGYINIQNLIEQCECNT